MREFTDRLPVSESLEFDFGSDEIWSMISEPGNLNHSHPFCKSNEVTNGINKTILTASFTSMGSTTFEISQPGTKGQGTPF